MCSTHKGVTLQPEGHLGLTMDEVWTAQTENWRGLVRSKAAGGWDLEEECRFQKPPEALSARLLHQPLLQLMMTWQESLLGHRNWWKVSRKGRNYRGGVTGKP